MGVRDIRFGDAFTSWAIGAAMGGIAIFALLHLKSATFRPIGAPPEIRQAQMATAYPSYFWDLRDPGQTQANFDEKYYPYNGIPVDGMFDGAPPDFTQPNFSEAYGPAPYTAPKYI